MRLATVSAIEDHGPAAVIFDMLKLDYFWGDAIGQIAMPLRETVEMFLPARILAQGETARSLAPLTEKNWIFGVAGITICDSLEAALKEMATESGIGG